VIRTTQAMLDLETLSARKNAAIVQIAAVAFDPQDGEIRSEFNRFVNTTYPEADISIDTIAWWMQQSFAPQLGKLIAENGVPLVNALQDFCTWYAGQTVEAIWSHGATFDLPVTCSALAACGIKQPWSYRAERDTRTLYALAPGGMPAVTGVAGTQHDALYDCHIQLKQVVGALAALKGGAK
jgi:hypothetical protein